MVIIDVSRSDNYNEIESTLIYLVRAKIPTREYSSLRLVPDIENTAQNKTL